MATKTIPFDFASLTKYPKLACAIASLITSDMEKLDKQVNGESRTITTFPRPLKAYYALDIVSRAEEGGKLKALEAPLVEYAKHADEHIRKREGQRGHPFSIFVEASPTKPQPIKGDDMNPTQDNDIKAIIDENIPVPSRAQPQPKPAQAAPVATLPEPAPMLDDAQANALKALLDTLQPKPVQATIDPDQLRELVRDELARQGKPKAISVTINDKVTQEIKDLGVQHKLFPTLVRLVEFGRPVWIPGPAGGGKTTAVHNAAKAINATLFMPPEGPIENKYGMIGYQNANGQFVETSLYKAAKLAQDKPDHRVIYFIDECDAGYPNALLVLNAVMENGYCTFANGETVKYGRNLQFIAGANTWGNGATHEYVGRNKLDAATLDRFVMLPWEYDEALERALAQNDSWVSTVIAARKRLLSSGVKQLITPRASIHGAAMLRAGFSESEVKDMMLYKGLSADQRRMVGG